MLTRRQFLASGAAVTVGGSLAKGDSYRTPRPLGQPLDAQTGNTVAFHLEAAERLTQLPCFFGKSLPMWTFTEGSWPPIIRMHIGDTLAASLQNNLPRPGETTSVHWHGIRLPNDQDGVPHLVQAPVPIGGRFDYRFAPPDCGTYFFHTHCNTVEQLGRGLEGVLIVHGDETEPYDDDEVLLLRDWVIDGDTGEFSRFFTLRGAGRAGTYGPLRTVNGAANPLIPLPACGDCRLRLINSDPTRIMEIEVNGAEAVVIAIDGIAVTPFVFSSWTMGPAMRIDLVMRAPDAAQQASLVDRSGGTSVELARFVGAGDRRRDRAFDPAPLRASKLPQPDLRSADRLRFSFDASEVGQALTLVSGALGASLEALCLSERTFWTINGWSWPDREHARLPPPFALLDRGASYIFELTNRSAFSHPIHIHGHTFSFLHSNKRELPAHHADTMLILPGETAEVAFVADNPGDWMFHCHVIEHQETGMMGYFRVV